MAIITIQNRGGVPPSTIFPAFKVLNKATARKQNIKIKSLDITFLKDAWSFMELQIVGKQPIPKLLVALTFAVPLTRSNVSFEVLLTIVSTEKINRKIINKTKNNMKPFGRFQNIF